MTIVIFLFITCKLFYCVLRKLPWFKHDVLSRCINVGSWIRIRNIYFNGIVLPISCRPSKLHVVFKVS